jgi:hypothetical protein
VIPSLAAALVAASGALGCAGPEVASTGAQTPRPAPAGSIAGPFVQAGAVFGARMNGSIDTFYTTPGTPFSVTVVNPIYDTSGHMAVPYGAKVYGTVESGGTDSVPRLRVRLSSIETVAGTLPVELAVRHAQHVDWTGPARAIPQSTSWNADSYLSPSDLVNRGDRPAAWSGATGAPYYGTVVRAPREIRVPENAMVELVLVRPLALPGSRVAPAM